MNTRRTSKRRVEEDLSNAGVHPQDNQDPPQVQAPVIPLPMMDVEIRSAFLCLAQVMATQDRVLASQAQAMTSQANREVGPRVQPNSSTTASLLRTSCG